MCDQDEHGQNDQKIEEDEWNQAGCCIEMGFKVEGKDKWSNKYTPTVIPELKNREEDTERIG